MTSEESYLRSLNAKPKIAYLIAIRIIYSIIICRNKYFKLLYFMLIQDYLKLTDVFIYELIDQLSIYLNWNILCMSNI